MAACRVIFATRAFDEILNVVAAQSVDTAAFIDIDLSALSSCGYRQGIKGVLPLRWHTT